MSHVVGGSMPHMSDAARKRQLADWVVKMKRQVVKVYAIAKWSRDAGVVQKAMVYLPLGYLDCAYTNAYVQNITAFLMDQNRQFEDAIMGLKYGRDMLDPARYVSLLYGMARCSPSLYHSSILSPCHHTSTSRTRSDA